MNVFAANAKKLRELEEAVHKAIARRRESKERAQAWADACAVFHKSYNELAFPGGLGREFERLKSAEPEAIEMGIRFLEADPWFFRSGYHKGEILRFLKHVALDTEQRARLRELVIRKIEGPPVREFKYYARLAPVIADEGFEARLTAFLDSENSRAGRARRVIECLKNARAKK